MKKGKKVFQILSLILASALTLAACSSGNSGQKEATGTGTASGSTSGSDKVYEISFGNFNPGTGGLAKFVLEPWKKLVEEKTNGRVKVNLFHGAALGGPNTVLKDVKGGVYDMGWVFSHYHQDSEIFPITVGDLPFATSDDIRSNTKIMNQFYDTKLKGTMLQDVELVGILSATPSNFFSKKPITKVEDFKGLKVRASGKSDAETLKDWGAVPVNVALNELYDALSKGIIDAVATADSLGLDGNLNEVANHYTHLPFKVIHTLTIMNKDTFNSFPDDLKSLFRNELFPAFNELNTNYSADESVKAKDKVKQLLEGKGSFNVFSAEETAKLKELTKSTTKSWIEDANKRGYNGEQLIKDYQELQKAVQK